MIVLSLLPFCFGCERDADMPIVEDTPHEKKVENIDSKIDLIIESYLSAGKKQNYDELLIEKALEIEQHGNIAKNLLLKRIGSEPKKDLLLVEAYFQIVGVSKDSYDSHLSFISKFGLKVDLLADISGELCEAYGVWQEKEKNGIKKMGIVRSTFVINKNGELVDVIYGVVANGHAQEMLEKVKTL